MYLESLELRSATGLPNSISLDELPPGLVLIVGPNASGKSTIGRIICGTLWPHRAPSGVDARTIWRTTANAPACPATVVFGRAQWDEEVLSPPPELEPAWHLTLFDLLEARDASDVVIARRIQTQLLGGYDLEAVGPRAKPLARPSRTFRRPFDESAARLREIIATVDALAEDEARLETLGVEVAAANGAPVRLLLVGQARQRLAVMTRLRGVEEAIAALPKGIAKLPPNAQNRALELDERVVERGRLLRERELTRDRCAEEEKRLTIPGDAPTEAALRTLAEEAAALVVTEQAVQAATRARDAEAAAAAEVRAQVWSGSVRDDLPSREHLEGLRESTEALRTARAELRRVPNPVSPPGDLLATSGREHLEDARSVLRQWLSAPRGPIAAPAPEAPRTWLVVLVVLGVALVLAGIVLAAASSWFGAVLLAAGAACVGVAGGMWVAPRMAGAKDVEQPSEAEMLQRRYETAGFPAVEEWTVVAVETVLEYIGERLQAAKEAERIMHEAEKADRARALARVQVEQLEAERLEKAHSFGLAESLPPLALVTQAERLVTFAERRRVLVAAEAELSSAVATHERDMARVRGLVESIGPEGLSELCTPLACKNAADLLLQRYKRWGAASEALRNADREVDLIREDFEKELAALRAHMKACGVSPSALEQLGELDTQRVRWEELEEERRALDRERAQLDEALGDALTPALRDDAAALNEEEARLDHLSKQSADLQAEVAAIEERVRQATQGHSVEEALAAKNAALDALVADRDQQLEHHVTDALLDWLRTHGAWAEVPAVLKRARLWFLQFTHQRYVLEVDGGHGFVAWDTYTNRRQLLSQLSDGTRVQLLLAARLAFIEEVERGGSPTPLFLDEALSTTDAERFRAVATAVLELTKAGRQVFYATADHAEAAQWLEVAASNGYDPPAVRNLGPPGDDGAWASLSAPTLSANAVPSPDGLDAMEYPAALGLPRPGLFDAAEIWPLAVVLFDRLDMAYAAARQGVKRVSQLELADIGVPLALDDATVELARARAAVVGAVLEALRVGRSAPVTWEVVVESNAITTAFEQRARELLGEHGHDGRAYVDAVGGLQRFRAKNREMLEQHLEAAGVLDGREMLDEEEVRKRALMACRGALEAGVLGLQEVDVLVQMVREVVG